jgi:hypothetical protein
MNRESNTSELWAGCHLWYLYFLGLTPTSEILCPLGSGATLALRFLFFIYRILKLPHRFRRITNSTNLIYRKQVYHDYRVSLTAMEHTTSFESQLPA